MPGRRPRLAGRIVEELDDALDWLESLGVEPTARETGNPLTVGRRYDTRTLTDVLVGLPATCGWRSPSARLGILATGGFGARLARERGLLLRANEWSEGDGLDYAVARGASLTAGLDQFYGRALPGGWRSEYVSAAQLYARHALVLDDEGRDLGEAAWHESDLVQRLPGGRAWYVVDARALRESVRERTVADLRGGRTRRPGGDVRPAEELPFALPASPKLVEPPFIAVRVHAAVTHTIGGLRIDERARVLDGDGRPVPDLYAAGADAGGIFTGGYGSGLAAALVFGRIAAESAAGLGELRVRAAAAIAGQRRRTELAHAQHRLARLDRLADGRRVAVALLQCPAVRRPDEEDVTGAALVAVLRHRRGF